jgi:hypothetical protein
MCDRRHARHCRDRAAALMATTNNRATAMTMQIGRDNWHHKQGRKIGQESLCLQLQNAAKFNWFGLRRMASLSGHLNMSDLTMHACMSNY